MPLRIENAQHSSHDQTRTLPLTPAATVSDDGQHSDAGNGEIPLASNLQHSYQIDWWFHTPETWLIDQVPGSIKLSPPSDHDLAIALDKIRSWLVRWTAGEANPLFHPEIYHYRLPECLQDAFMAWMSYQSGTKLNEETILRIISDKARALVAHHNNAKMVVDSLEHLARAQSLLVYQIIGLYGNDASLHSIAEMHIPILSQWIYDGINAARHHKDLDRYICPSKSRSNRSSTSWQDQLWHSWLLAESLRRTYVTVSMVQGMYLHKQTGIHACLGGMMFTSRKGFWNASDAQSWAQRCEEVNGGLMRIGELNKMMSVVEVGEVDEFAALVLKMTFGHLQIEKLGLNE